MPLPETIPVRYTEEEAEYLSIRPVVRQTFRFDELLDMILAATGKDLERIRQILRSGTVVFHFYRYWWPGFEADVQDLTVALSHFPDPDPRRSFHAPSCVAMILEAASSEKSLLIERSVAVRNRLFRRRSFWDSLMALAEEFPPSYVGYSYARRADTFRIGLAEADAARRVRMCVSLASRELRAKLRSLPDAIRIVLVCPR